MIRHIPRSLAFASVLTFFGASGYFACGDDPNAGGGNRDGSTGVKTDGTTGDGSTVRPDSGPDRSVTDGMGGDGDASSDGAAEEA